MKWKLFLLIAIVILIIMLSGGIIYYIKAYKKLFKEYGEFFQVVFEALKDKKITIKEKELIIKEWSDTRPLAKQIRSKFIDDAKELAEDIKQIYKTIKDKIKKK